MKKFLSTILFSPEYFCAAASSLESPKLAHVLKNINTFHVFNIQAIKNTFILADSRLSNC